MLLALTPALPAGAAARVVAPPGNSEADQYFETVPGSAGPRGPDSAKKEDDAVRDGSLTPATARALRQRGAAGRVVVTAVARTAPARTRGGGGGAGGRPGGGSPPSPSPASSPAVPGKPGLGALFPLALAATALAAAAFALGRRRRPAAR